MDVSILSVFPQLYEQFLQTSLVSRANIRANVAINVKSLFSFAKPKERIDTSVYGHGSGMVLRPDIIEQAVAASEKQYGPAYKIFFSPQGTKLNQIKLRSIVARLQDRGHCILLPARYEGMDERVEEYYADEILSVGDFVLMGGDLPAMMFLEGMLRLLPGVVAKKNSVQCDSFYGPFVDHPAYGAPVLWKDKEVPSVIRSGNHQEVDEWRLARAVKKTVLSHFDWMRSSALSSEQKKSAMRYIPAHYTALLHTDVRVGPQEIDGTTSVTSIDIHDISRSCSTYGIKNYFLVTPLKDQQAIVRKLLDFWSGSYGNKYDHNRQEAIDRVHLSSSLEEAIAEIVKKEGKQPLIIATSARAVEEVPLISYFDQERIWKEKRPVLLVFGTGRGLTDSFLRKSDFLLAPIGGFSDFNHLSVRSAVAIVLDRWLGINHKTGH